MGASFSSVKDYIMEPIRDSMLKQKVMEMRQNKMMRDTQIAMNVAMTEDRIYWMTGALGTLGLLGASFRAMGRKLPTPAIPGVIVTTVLLYQADMVWGDKLNRVHDAAERVKQDPRFWFNQKMHLPPQMRGPYRSVMDELNESLKAAGEPPAPEWAE